MPATNRASLPATLRALPMCLALAACATPEQSCILSAQQDYRVLDALYQETAANVERGYGLERVERTRIRLVPCDLKNKREFCQEEYIEAETVPVTIDLEEEKRILAQLQVSRAKAGRKADRAIAECKRTFAEPET
ncbi:MAG: hypothetical protein AAGD04_01000 [Pseudomonadota bacterium]